MEDEAQFHSLSELTDNSGECDYSSDRMMMPYSLPRPRHARHLPGLDHPSINLQSEPIVINLYKNYSISFLASSDVEIKFSSLMWHSRVELLFVYSLMHGIENCLEANV